MTPTSFLNPWFGLGRMDPMEPRRCKGTNREGNPCGRPPIKGGTVCTSHGGGAGQVRAAAARRVAEAEAAAELGKAMATLGDRAGDVDPAKALLDEISW